MKIKVAKNIGFCWGVKRALSVAEELLARGGSVYMLGPLVHNERVVEDLKKKGAQVVDDLDKVPVGAVLLIRAHGVGPQLYREAQDKGLKIADATCPKVLEIQEKARQLSDDKRTLVIIGDKGHQETKGIKAQISSGKVLVLKSVEDLKDKEDFLRDKRIGVVVQSTQSVENAEKILGKLKKISYDTKSYDTICASTKKRQKELRSIASGVDVMIVVGSHGSANTNRLYMISRKENERTYLIEEAADLKESWLEAVASVGIASGSSTPIEIIEEVVRRIKDA